MQNMTSFCCTEAHLDSSILTSDLHVSSHPNIIWKDKSCSIWGCNFDKSSVNLKSLVHKDNKVGNKCHTQDNTRENPSV